jgi:hypothetical protein
MTYSGLVCLQGYDFITNLIPSDTATSSSAKNKASSLAYTSYGYFHTSLGCPLNLVKNP